jgi:hypothetical protein
MGRRVTSGIIPITPITKPRVRPRRTSGRINQLFLYVRDE